jgi:exosortase/archaeosortase family protein
MMESLRTGSAWSRPAGCFITKVAAFMMLFLAVYRDDLLGRLLGPWEELTAQTTLVLLHFLNVEAARWGSQIHHPDGFAYEIYYRCTAVLVAALLTALTLATPSSARSKLIGLCAGIPVLVGLNLIRLVQLFHTGVFHPGLFDLAHGILWEFILVLATLGIWWRWSRWAIRANPLGRKRNDLVRNV